MKFLLKLLLLLAVIAVAYLLLVPAPINSVAVQVSQPLMFSGPLAVNDRLQSAELISLPAGQSGGEDIARDPLGCLYTGTEDGSVMRKCPYSDWEVLLNTHGRPLGLHFDASQNLIIADGEKGLLSMSPAGKLTVLADHFNGQRLGVVDDVDIGADGTIYFSDASNRYALKDIVHDVLDGRSSGRLFAFDPQTSSLTLLSGGLAFANGVAVSADQSYVLVNETFRYRIRKVWLSGDKAGQDEIITDNLPGMPDGIARAPDGSYWVAMYGLRPKLVDAIHDQPWLKNLLARLPESLAPVPKPYGFILQIDASGKILRSYHDQAAVAMGGITSVQPEADGLYLGTLHMGRIGKLSF
ncbi:MAG: gluconolactonase [Oceanospirillaceae bacterium]|uniref:SMP-30/gluconolactonase/LRE family protein n=1 Tax=unclassified Thalassolituus TaxID=2624967 RepID=UPI000C0B5F18|nr:MULTISPECIES: SMP-30/gluconolactonase/LRE family protein [unclassified Thalassolituus]MAK90398.1 gluconolactonase [Thalassolituus sp.]MAX98075.1 gluconolactonase [Oceanospirillaceae bacterium]|tara:strand:- start:1246 stop:2307 length:1062 start_codon:yes stop_codon:yes gene_type:complete